MPYIDISIKNKRAETVSGGRAICGNSDYVARFEFDEEWNDFETKTARIKYVRGGKAVHQDVIFTGTECPIPALSNISVAQIGVFAGDLHTTTVAVVRYESSVLCGAGVPEEPEVNAYNQIMERLDYVLTEDEQLAALVQADLLPAVYDSDGRILTAEGQKILLRY